MKKIFYIILFSIVCINSSFSQVNKKKKHRKFIIHSEVEVKARAPILQENVISEDLISTSRVGIDQLNNLGAYDLLTGLRMVPGVLISRYNLVGSYGGGDGGTLYIHGMGVSRPGSNIMFCLDGIPKFVSIWGHPLMDVLNIDFAESIDIIKGASPALYGNMGFGIVNIHSPKMKENGKFFETKVMAGTHKTLVGNVKFGYKKNSFDSFLIAGYRYSKGHRVLSSGQLQDYLTKIGYQINNSWKISFLSEHTKNYAQDPGPENSPPPLRGLFNTEDTLIIFTLENSLPNASGFIKFYHDKGKIDWQEWNYSLSLPKDSDTLYSNWGIKSKKKVQINDSLSIETGLDFDSYGGYFLGKTGNNISISPNKRFTNIAPFLLLKAGFGNSVKISPLFGFRLNHNNYFGNIFSPQIGFSLQKGTSLFHSSISRGFNLPGVFTAISYENWWHQGTSWKKLNSEKILHFENGLSQSINNRLKVDITFFHDRVTGALRFFSPPPHYENIGEYSTNGIDTSINAIINEKYSIFSSYTWMAKKPSTTPETPDNTFSMGLNYYPTSRTTLSIDGQYVGSRYWGNPRFSENRVKLDDFFTLNARFQVIISPLTWKERIFIFGSIENITNTKYEYRPHYPMPGCLFFGGIRLQINNP